MRRTAGLILAALLAAALLGGCEENTHEILSKAETAYTKTQLEKALGAPDIVQKVGPLETWTYKASNGEVTFMLAGDAVTVRTASSSSRN